MKGSPSTVAGIRLGSSESALVAAYPGIRRTPSTGGGSTGATYVAGPVGGRYLVFQIAVSASGARTVTIIQSSPAASLTDTCE
jgi:hypothetical protein